MQTQETESPQQAQQALCYSYTSHHHAEGRTICTTTPEQMPLAYTQTLKPNKARLANWDDRLERLFTQQTY